MSHPCKLGHARARARALSPSLRRSCSRVGHDLESKSFLLKIQEELSRKWRNVLADRLKGRKEGMNMNPITWRHEYMWSASTQAPEGMPKTCKNSVLDSLLSLSGFHLSIPDSMWIFHNMVVLESCLPVSGSNLLMSPSMCRCIFDALVGASGPPSLLLCLSDLPSHLI